MKNANKKQIAKITVFIMSLFIIFMSVSFAFINLTLQGTKRQVITAGTLSLELKEDENNLTIANAMPMYDEVGMIQDAFTFRLINNGTTSANYKIKLVEVGTGTLDKSDVKYGLVKDGQTSISYLSNLTDGVIDAGTISGNATTIEYELRLWISDTVQDNSQIEGKVLTYKIDVQVDQIIIDENNCEVLAENDPNAPILTSGMIAVTYDETNKTWIKADSSTSDWYDYDNQIWANAVTVTEESRANYMSLDAGEPINMDDINTMWVWIPRYSYTIKQPYGRGAEQKCSDLEEITTSSPSECYNPDSVVYPDELRQAALAQCQTYFDSGVVTSEEECLEELVNVYGSYYDYDSFEEYIDAEISWASIEDTRVVTETYPENAYNAATQSLPGSIDIKFISTGEMDAGTGQCKECAENWVTPEGFTFGNEELSGFWVAKFETSTLETCTPAYNSVNSGCDLATFTLQVKPNVTSWMGARVSTFFEASRSMQSSANASTYGFTTTDNGTMDVHMMKNTEWGIVAMLSQSKYGKYGNPNYEGANKEVYQNKSSSYITGMSNGTPSINKTNTQVTYDTPDTGYGASTTGTIYGVYDMAGGTYEYVMGNYNNVSGNSTTYNSGFCGTNGPTEDCVEWPDAKYYDLYTSDDPFTEYKAGDATYETSGWYIDHVLSVDSKYPWYIRGGEDSYAVNAGVFNRYAYSGFADGEYFFIGTRLLIKP